MQEQKQNATIDETKRATEYLANERTFLAWIRTSVAVMSLGFVLARFSVWLRELSAQRQPQVPVHHGGISLPIGVAMMILGGALTILAAWRYPCGKSRHRTRQSDRRSWTCDFGDRDGHAAFCRNDRVRFANGGAAVSAIASSSATSRARASRVTS